MGAEVFTMTDPGVHDADPGVHDADPGVHDADPGVHDADSGVHDADLAVHDGPIRAFTMDRFSQSEITVSARSHRFRHFFAQAPTTL